MLLQYFHIDMSHLPEGSKNTNIVGVDHDPEYVELVMPHIIDVDASSTGIRGNKLAGCY